MVCSKSCVSSLLVSLLTLAQLAQSQKTKIHTVTPLDVALISHNVSAPNEEKATFQVYDQSFQKILGNKPSFTLIAKADQPLFHETGLYIDGENPTIYVTSNQFKTEAPSPATDNKQIVITRIDKDSKTGKWSFRVINPEPEILLANGGFFYNNSIFFTAQGNLKQAGGITQMSLKDTANPEKSSYPTKKLLNNYLGLPFNSPNDAFFTRDGKVWFTDPTYGYQQGIRPKPQLPAQVYLYVPGTTEIRPVEAGIIHPNGITFSPDQKTAYISDGTGSYAGDPRPRVLWAYNVEDGFLTGKRLFTQPGIGIPDGIKVDSEGNIYAGCGDGVNVWNPAGKLLGKIIVDGGASNFAFGPNGQLFLLNEERLWLAQLSTDVQPAIVNRLMGGKPSKSGR